MMNLLNSTVKSMLLDGVWNWIKTLGIECIASAEKNLKGSTNAEKRKYVVEQLDNLVVLPPLLELADGFVFGVLVDWLCNRLNLLTDGDKAAVADCEDLAAEAVEADEKKLAEVGSMDISLDEKFDALLKSKGLDGQLSDEKKN